MAQFIREGQDVLGAQYCADFTSWCGALSSVEYAEDLEAITVYAVRNQVRPVWDRPFPRLFDSSFSTHCGKLSQFVYAGEDRFGEVVSSLGVFKCNIAGFVLQVFECFFQPLNLHSDSSAEHASLPLAHR